METEYFTDSTRIPPHIKVIRIIDHTLVQNYEELQNEHNVLMRKYKRLLANSIQEGLKSQPELVSMLLEIIHEKEVLIDKLMAKTRYYGKSSRQKKIHFALRNFTNEHKSIAE